MVVGLIATARGDRDHRVAGRIGGAADEKRLSAVYSAAIAQHQDAR